MERGDMGILDSLRRKKLEQRSKEVTREAPPSREEAVAGRWRVGDRIQNRYEIYHVLSGSGKSGMGIVYICYDQEFKEPVVLKTFQDKYLRERAAINRFKWEAEAWVRLEKHYNIVQAKYVDEILGRPFIFLEYIVGEEQYGADLSGWIWGGGLRKEGSPDIPLILNFALQFCHGMIHAEGKFQEMGRPFVHRDVKPQNIMVTRDRVVKVTDFGLVKTFAESGEDIPSTTVGDESRRRLSWSKSANVCGTPPYMSPEQCRGDIDIDTRVDIYSFGCVLYEMLTGRCVFDARSVNEFINHHLNTIPRSPGAHQELDRIIMKCLEKERAKRYQNFRELEKDLSRLYHELTGEAVETPGMIEMEAWELSDKGASLTTLGLHQEAIDCYRQALKLNPNLAGTHNNLGVTYKAQGRLDEAVREYQEALRLNPDYAGAHNNLGVTYKAQGRLDGAIREYRKALRLSPDYAEAHYNLGLAYKAQGRLDEATKEYQEALKLNPELAEAHNDLGNAYAEQGWLYGAMKEYQEALRLNPNNAEVHNNLGNAYAEQGRLDEAIGEYQEALRLNPGYVMAHNNLGLAYAEREMLDEAIGEYQEALRLSPELAEAHNNLGNAYYAQGMLNEAMGEYQEALRLNPNNAEAHNNLGSVYNDQGRHDEAIGEFKAVLRLKPDYAAVHYNLGLAYDAQGKFREAIGCYQTFIRVAPPQYDSYIRQAEESIRQLQKRYG